MNSAFAGRDWEAFAALFAPGYRAIDRRRMAQIESNREESLASFRWIFDRMPGSQNVDCEVLATRGERFALRRVCWSASGTSVSRMEIEWLDVLEVDDDGRVIVEIGFDVDDLDAAYDELEHRYEASEAHSRRRASLTRAFCNAFAARDWEALQTLLAPDLVVNDGRVLGWETSYGPAAYIQALQSLVDLAPDAQLHVDHLTMSGNQFLYVTTWRGTHEGGAFESPSVIICELDEMERIRRFDQYEIGRLDELRAHFERTRTDGASDDALREGTRPESRPDARAISPNAASRLRDRINEAFLRKDWQAMRALAGDGMVFEDRRTLVGTSGGVELWIKGAEAVHEASDLDFRDVTLATIGDRLDLRKRVVSGRGPDSGPFDVEFLILTEIDEDGRLAASINFDAEASSEAFAETQRRASRAGAVKPPQPRR